MTVCVNQGYHCTRKLDSRRIFCREKAWCTKASIEGVSGSVGKDEALMEQKCALVVKFCTSTTFVWFKVIPKSRKFPKLL